MKTFKEIREDKSLGKKLVDKVIKTATSVADPPKVKNPIYLIKRKIKSAYYTPKSPK